MGLYGNDTTTNYPDFMRRLQMYDAQKRVGTGRGMTRDEMQGATGGYLQGQQEMAKARMQAGIQQQKNMLDYSNNQQMMDRQDAQAKGAGLMSLPSMAISGLQAYKKLTEPSTAQQLTEMMKAVRGPQGQPSISPGGTPATTQQPLLNQPVQEPSSSTSPLLGSMGAGGVASNMFKPTQPDLYLGGGFTPSVGNAGLDSTVSSLMGNGMAPDMAMELGTMGLDEAAALGTDAAIEGATALGTEAAATLAPEVATAAGAAATNATLPLLSNPYTAAIPLMMMAAQQIFPDEMKRFNEFIGGLFG
jgi:hypothetical protein